MNKRILNSFLFYLLLTITLNFPTLLYSQIKSSYTIGGFGTIGSMVGISTYSNPLLLSGSKCYVVSNGIVKFLPVGTGQFFTTCEVNLDYIKINIKVFPNPTSNYTIIHFLNKLQNDDKFKVKLYNSLGDLVDVLDVSQNQLLSGFQYPMEKFVAGMYYLQISSSTVYESFKIFKL